MRFSGAAPVSFPPWPPNLRLERQGGSLNPLLVEWLSLAVLWLALSLRLPFSVKRSRCCERGSSRWLFSHVRSLCGRWRFTDRYSFPSVLSSGLGGAGGGFSGC